MTRLVKSGLKPGWKPSDLNWWITQRNRNAALVADNMYLAAQGTGLNWLSIVLVGVVRTHYFKNIGMDAFGTGETDPNYEVQADLAPGHWIHRESVEEVLGGHPDLLYAYDSLYAQAARFLDGMAERRQGDVKPLPVPQSPRPTPPPTPKPAPPKPKPTPTPVPEDRPLPQQPGLDWRSVVIPVISAIVGLVAGAIGPWGGLLKVIWGVIQTIIGG